MFGKDIEIRLDKYQFGVDDKITGVVILKLSKIVKAKGLFVSLVVKEKVNRVNVGRGSAGVSSSQSTREVFRFDLPLDGEREYVQGGEYPFEMQIPQEAWPSGTQGMMGGGGIVGKGIGLLASLSPLGNKVRTYEIQSHLDIPWGLDAKGSVDITVL